MIICDNRMENSAVFADLLRGDVFQSEGNYYLKVDEDHGFDLTANGYEFFYSTDICTPLSAKIVIE